MAIAHTGVQAMVECLTAEATVTASLSILTGALEATTVDTAARLFVSIRVQQSAAQTYAMRLAKIVREE